MVERKFSFFDQFLALLKKSAINQKRQYVTNFCQVFCPVFLLSILFLIQLLVTSIIQSEFGQYSEAINNPQIQASYLLTPAPASLECPESDGLGLEVNNSRIIYSSLSGVDVGTYGGFTQEELRLLFPGAVYENPHGTASGIMGNYTAAGSDLSFEEALVAKIDILSSLRGFSAISFPDRGFVQVCFSDANIIVPEIYSVNSREDLDEVLFEAYGEVNKGHIAGYDFKQMDVGTQQFEYSVFVNTSLTSGSDYTNYIKLMDNALWKSLVNSAGDLLFSGTKNYPSGRSENTFDLVSLISSALLIYVFQLLFPVFITALVYEKENSLREIMKMMGLDIKVYWVVTYFFNLALYILSILFLYAIGYLMDFKIFTVNNFGVYFLVFFIWGNTMIAMAFFFSVFFTKSLSATVVGYMWVFGTGLLAASLVDGLADGEGAATVILSLIPPFAMYRALGALSTGVAFDNPGINFSNFNEPEFRLFEVCMYLVVEWAVMLILAIYLEMVLPIGPGLKKHPLFFLPGFKEKTPHSDYVIKDEEAIDVALEREKTYSSDAAIKCFDLVKIYPNKFVAVNGLTMSIDYNECFGFLGPNGAGKSTTINMLCGYLRPSTGSAEILGLDLQSKVDEIHLEMGVCPQDNVLWDDLTGPEHLEFYGRLKGLKGSHLKQRIKVRLQEVNLWSARNKLSSQYSGGMKRRLCVAMCMIGDPGVILLDEPTTGLDPASKRQLWEVVLAQKKKSSILLTTHSMEEAEALCDRLGIFVSGQLVTLGSSQNLKSRFGTGFRLVVTSTKEKKVRKFVQNLIPQAESASAPIGGTQTWDIPKDAIDLSDLFREIEQVKKKLKITDWGVSNTTLEEVFHRITEDENFLIERNEAYYANLSPTESSDDKPRRKRKKRNRKNGKNGKNRKNGKNGKRKRKPPTTSSSSPSVVDISHSSEEEESSEKSVSRSESSSSSYVVLPSTTESTTAPTTESTTESSTS
eukprot:TRINITY_DN7523_c0_g1_i1.p1 TRINITY_DN7523_c0_g1~~TRINITY_DN7523_c0_g1_i1.p1  ORF type:complete len:975 (-),score=216.56 TRINITY_DN7523_c0_g1_i1:41-2965(-)